MPVSHRESGRDRQQADGDVRLEAGSARGPPSDSGGPFGFRIRQIGVPQALMKASERPAAIGVLEMFTSNVG